MDYGVSMDEVLDTYVRARTFLGTVRGIIDTVSAAAGSDSIENIEADLEPTARALMDDFRSFSRLRAFALQTATSPPLGKSDSWAFELVEVVVADVCAWILSRTQQLRASERKQAGLRGPLNYFEGRRSPCYVDQERLDECFDILQNEEALLVSFLRAETPHGAYVHVDTVTPADPGTDLKPPRKRTKPAGAASTRPGDAHMLQWSLLNSWHCWDGERKCVREEVVREEPVKVRELARFAKQLRKEGDPASSGASRSSLQRFFERGFGSHEKYCQQCHAGRIRDILRERLDDGSDYARDVLQGEFDIDHGDYGNETRRRKGSDDE